MTCHYGRTRMLGTFARRLPIRRDWAERETRSAKRCNELLPVELLERPSRLGYDESYLAGNHRLRPGGSIPRKWPNTPRTEITRSF